MTTDRNLLFGVLALQADLLTPAQFAEACSAWAGRKDLPLADLLVERGWLAADDVALANRLLGNKLAKYGGDPQATLAVEMSEGARHSLAGMTDPDIQATVAPDGPRRGALLSTSGVPGSRDRYTASRLHASGGLGRVWLAHDAGMGREVALKELLPERAGLSTAAERFLREARITGQLEHPGIVPVYELVNDPAAGSPFYTMRFIRGRTLGESIADYHRLRQSGTAGSLEFRELLSAFVLLCQAVAYAHSRRVIHRDLKPANVVIGDFGEVILLDWGIAKVLGEPDAADPNRTVDTNPPLTATRDEEVASTQAGQVLGTPSYMAPEQAAGEVSRIDERTDVYGLGAILFELLTGTVPFRGESLTKVLEQVRTAPPPRPTAVATGVPMPLEAVCLKCLSKAPTDRYPDARALADEVKHFPADEPVTVYRDPLRVRVGRWARRHRTLVAGLVVTLAVAVPILVAGVVLLKQSEGRERAARESEEAARVRAEANYAKSLRAADAMAEEVARGIKPIAGTQSKDVLAILDRASRVYDELLSDPDAPPEALERKARTLVQFADLYRQTNRTGAGRQSAEQAMALYERLLAARPDARELRIGRAVARHRQAWALFDQGYEDDSLAAFRASAAELDAVGGLDPQIVATCLASSVTFEGNLLTAFGDHDAAEPVYRRALQLRRTATADAKGDPVVRGQLALSLEKLGAFLVTNRAKESGATKEGLAMLREARTELEAVCQADPWDTSLHLRLVQLLTTLAQSSPDKAEVAACLEACQRVVDRFANRDPDHLLWRREVLRLRYYRMEQRLKTALSDDAPDLPAIRREWLSVLESMLATILEITRQDPENYFWTADVANFQRRAASARLGFVRREPGGNHLARAEELAQASVSGYEKQLVRSPANVEFAQDLHAGLDVLARVHEARKDPATASAVRWEYQRRSVAHYQRLSSKYPKSQYWDTHLRGAYLRCQFSLKLRDDDENWKAIVARPAAIVAAVRLADSLAATPPGLSEGRVKDAHATKESAAKLLAKFAAAGLLPPAGQPVLEKLRTAEPKKE